MSIGVAGMAKVIGQLALKPGDIEKLREDVDKYVAELTNEKLSDEERRFLKDYYITDIIAEYTKKLGIKYSDNSIDKRK